MPCIKQPPVLCNCFMFTSFDTQKTKFTIVKVQHTEHHTIRGRQFEQIIDRSVDVTIYLLSNIEVSKFNRLQF